MQRDAVSDEDLVIQAQGGDLDAYDSLVARYQEKIWSLLYKFCPHQSELEDLVQETLIKAYNNLHKWRPEGRFRGWLMRIATNTGYDYCRRRKNEPITIAQKGEVDSDLEPLNLVMSKDETKESHPYSDIVERILIELKPEDRMVVTLQYYERIPLPEIAERLNWNLSKTKVRSHRARKRLETALKRHGIESV